MMGIVTPLKYESHPLVPGTSVGAGSSDNANWDDVGVVNMGSLWMALSADGYECENSGSLLPR